MTRQAVLTAPRRLEYREANRRNLMPWEARIAVARAGVCGTDLAIYKGDYRVPLPLVLGHEFCGAVREVGAEGSKDFIGKRCTAEINNSCLATRSSDPCAACRRSMPRHCQKRSVVGIDQWDGAFAREIIVPVDNVHLLPDAISDDAGVFIEPLAAAIQTFEMAPLDELKGTQPDTPIVVVLGVGRLGVLVAAVAKNLGAHVIGIAHAQETLERARPYCDELLAADRPDKVVTFVRQKTAGLGADYVVEATGSPLGLHFAGQLVRPRGTIALKSTPGVPVDRLNLTALVVNEVRVQGSRCGLFDKAIAFMAGGAIDFAPFVNEQYPLEQTHNAIEAAEHAAKVLIRCSE